MSDIYERQDLIEGIDKDQTITVVGCGGIGFWVAKFAAMSGIEKIYLFDDDVLEEGNLNRLDVPDKFIGRNKADVVKVVINTLRPECTVYAFPFRLTENHMIEGSFLIDCTDEIKSQTDNQEIARKKGMTYLKAGYDGEDFSIHNSVAEWGEAPDGYTKTPSWVVPATIIAAMTIAKIMKYKDLELISNVRGLFNAKRS